MQAGERRLLALFALSHQVGPALQRLSTLFQRLAQWAAAHFTSYFPSPLRER